MHNGNPENFKEWWQTRPTWIKAFMIGFVVVGLLVIIGGSIAVMQMDFM